MNKGSTRYLSLGAFFLLLVFLLVWLLVPSKPLPAETQESPEISTLGEASTNGTKQFNEAVVTDEPALNVSTVSSNYPTATNISGEIAAQDNASPPPEESPGFPERRDLDSPLVLPNPFTNSLGMRFVVVPETAVLFSVWETRVEDYQAFATATHRDWPKPKWPVPNFQQGSTHPAVMVSWHDAKAFCVWLTEKDRQEEQFANGIIYRLPTVAEWSVAGCGAMSGNETLFPWGDHWPPPAGAGNYSQKLGVDSFPYTSPVESFPPNRFGLYDMVGNVAQWCDVLPPPKPNRPFNKPTRGGSWGSNDPRSAACSHDMNAGYISNFGTGFRVVVAIEPQ